ncbi:phage virion morphogenesis protein [Sphingomonas oligophenolica]|uniref:Phage virion morphogenesis protein n=1 Tax=Sphingomonas oligophenolica TaxID=301154 RepID=A0A502CQG4_9SPHN|nr:phage virion morphogenesis protein [Sphingomonas oligophenolica]TPG14359.1 phage virion morphogenesis protein [Sphingomonas oligophenolica]
MAGDLEQIEELAGNLLRSIAPAERRRLLRTIARDIQKSQSTRIGQQKSPEGNSYAPRRDADGGRQQKPGGYAVKFLYPKGAAEPRAVFMKSWIRQGPLMTGYDIDAGGIRSFFWDQVAKWLPVDAADRNKAGGKLRRRGTIRARAMFRKLRNPRNLRSQAGDREAWIGFTGRAAEIATVHQDGGTDRPAKNAKPVRYAQRGLLGLTLAERSRMLDTLYMYLDHAS